jgi:cell division septum initiation protein DivIVA
MRTTTAVEAEPDTPDRPAPPDQAPGNAEQAAALHGQAAQMRADTQAARTEADRLQQSARAEAQRLVADADQEANRLRNKVLRLEREVVELDGLASYHDQAVSVRAKIEVAARDVARLTGEAEELRAQVAALDERLAGHGTSRQDAAASLDAALEGGDVAKVVELRAKVAAVDEVTGVLEGRRRTLAARLLAVGDADDGAGELYRADLERRNQQGLLRRTLNTIDPQRPEAEYDRLHGRLVSEFGSTAAGNVLRLAEELSKQGVTRR